MTSQNEFLPTSSESKIRELIQSRKKITFREIINETHVTIQVLEDFLIPLLGEGSIVGTLELHCPDCGADLGSYNRYNQVPQETPCEICGENVVRCDEYLDIILEVKGEFFEANQLPPPCIDKKVSKTTLKSMLSDSIKEPGRIAKGEKFEQFFVNLLCQEQGFQLLKPHARSDVGEIDFVCRADLTGHPLWVKCAYLFIECKNWKDIIPSEKMTHYITLLEQKNLLSNCAGVYLTTSAFSPEAMNSVKNAINKRLIIILIDRNDLSDLIGCGFQKFLEKKYDELISKI